MYEVQGTLTCPPTPPHPTPTPTHTRDLSSVATCHVVSDPRDLSNMAIYPVRSTRNVHMPPHPTPTPRQRAILKKEAKRTYGFPAVGIYFLCWWYTTCHPSTPQEILDHKPDLWGVGAGWSITYICTNTFPSFLRSFLPSFPFLSFPFLSFPFPFFPFLPSFLPSFPCPRIFFWDSNNMFFYPNNIIFWTILILICFFLI